ncbi:MAG: 50S ribosomal protein L37e [Candidatus Aenigmarchaeota archaeon]|nr:50S ribosomal protein L37e [Candidatus Aenigmarchaeota archaeon]MCK5062876.1 50S ribosomal protein L37e [Candidatus Aenigmarchaeota archaeon]
MSKGKASFGKMNKSVHKNCRRCGEHSFHLRHRECSSCGFGKTSKLRSYSWQNKGGLGSYKK